MPDAAAPDKAPQRAAPALLAMTRRADFLRAASARRQGTASLTLQARERGDGSEAIRLGLTASRKIGNAVARNRARRRLRAAAGVLLPRLGRPGWDYVIVARPGATVAAPWEALAADLARALQAVHRPRAERPADGGEGGRRRR